MKTQTRPRRKSTGGLYRGYRKKTKYELAGRPANTELGEKKVKKVKTCGGHQKNKLVSCQEVNLADKKGKVSKVKIKNVKDNPANKHLARRNILTKGAIIETAKGKARVTSRPGQDGLVNAILIE